MLSRTITINNAAGLHSRLATLFVEKAKNFTCNVRLQKGEVYCNAKEFLKILKMGITHESEITLWCDGVDEQAAMDLLAHYLETLAQAEQEAPLLSSEEAKRLLMH